ncbi:hypothetical protein L1987_06008 [Smallanthus sonchifolius]|uniref:Uncharacterized protein n=1 Tax=Smallanthus sonchifolius TaxID=185202 RepID=A0ACB9JX41_9ASTR|nr:hypothetical protein L1987_06008 [Smallanthus sonchifolius]
MAESSRHVGRKRRNTRSGSRSGSSSSAHMGGSSQTPPSPPPPFHPQPMPEGPQDLHPWLIFDPDDAIEVHAYQTLPTLLRQTFGAHKTICYSTLEDINLLENAVPVITNHWQRFFAIREATYYELTLEFLASFQFDRPVAPFPSLPTPMYCPFHRGRKDSTGVVSVRDLHLHCLIDGVPCNLAYSLAKFFTRATGNCSNNHVFGELYITHLASYLGVLSPANLGILTEIDLPILHVDTQVLINMHMMKKFNGLYRLVGHPGNI